MIKCSFCENQLVCKSCSKPVHPPTDSAHLSIYQPDVSVACPECHKLLVCKTCGYVYAEQDDKEE